MQVLEPMRPFEHGNVASDQSGRDLMDIKLLWAALLCILATGCSTWNSEEILGSCWNVNELTHGQVAGQGVFVTSMEGLSLQSPGCSDQKGQNSFELKPAAGLAVQDYLKNHVGDRLIGFAFHGQIDSVGGGKLLMIEQVDELRPVQEPQWMSDLQRHHGLSN